MLQKEAWKALADKEPIIRPKNHTLRAVAETAGVSLATVSRVISGKARVSTDVHARVCEAATKLGVDLDARKRANVVAFLLSNKDTLHPFHSRVLVGAADCLALHHYHLLFSTLAYREDVPWKELHLPGILQRRDLVGGVILAGNNSPNLLQALSRRNVPFAVLGNNVLAEWRPEEYDVVSCNDRQGAYEITRYLQALGHRDIWFVGNFRLPYFVRCFQGYRRAMEESGLQSRQRSIDSKDDQEVGYVATKSIFSGAERVTAIFAGTDAVAQGVYKAIVDSGLQIPDDVSVVSCNDTQSAMLIPPLTSVREFPEQVGKQLAETVLRRIAQRDMPPQQYIIPTELIERASCRAIRPRGIAEERRQTE